MSSVNFGLVYWETCQITNTLNQKLEILSLAPEFQFYEDIYSPIMSGAVTIVDTFNLITRFPFIGEEELHVKFYTPRYYWQSGDSNYYTFEKTFVIYKIDEKKTHDNKHIYNLHFISRPGYKSLQTQISKAFKGTGKSIVDQIHTFYLKNDVTYERLECLGPETANPLHFVSPYWSPLECIDYAVKNSLASTELKQADYLYFENNESFVFSSLDYLKSVALKDDHKYKYDQALMIKNNADVVDIFRNIIDVRWRTVADFSERNSYGAYAKNTIAVDLLFKTIDFNKKYEIDAEFKKLRHLGEHPHYSNSKTPPRSDEDYKTKIEYGYTGVYGDYRQPDLTPHAKHTREPILAQNEFIKLDLDIWGNSALKVGDVMHLTFGLQSSFRLNNANLLDPMFTGKYLLTAIYHRVSANEYLQTVSVVKDAIDTEIETYCRQETEYLMNLRRRT